MTRRETRLTKDWVLSEDYGLWVKKAEIIKRRVWGHQENRKRMATVKLATEMKSYYESHNPLARALNSASLYIDLLNYAMMGVEWRQVAELFLEDWED